MPLLFLSWNGLPRYRIDLQYLGGGFRGAQFQKQLRTVESVFIDTLKSLNFPVAYIGLGARTDAGVHSVGQVAVLDCPLESMGLALLHGINARLPDDIRVSQVRVVCDGFHPRGSARYREYRYYWSPSELPLALRGVIASFNYDLDLKLLNNYAKKLIGCHDFGGFENAGSPGKCRKKLVVRSEFFSSVDTCSRFPGSFKVITYVIVANSFLYRMVRNVVGALVAVASGSISEVEFDCLLFGGVRDSTYKSAPANGLDLVKIYF